MYRATVSYVVNGSTHSAVWTAKNISSQRDGDTLQLIFPDGDGTLGAASTRDPRSLTRVHSISYANAPVVLIEGCDA